MPTERSSVAGATDIDGGVDFVRDTVTPLIRQQHGYLGMVVSADRKAKLLGILSTWDTEADLDASNSAHSKPLKHDRPACHMAADATGARTFFKFATRRALVQAAAAT